LAGDGGTRYIRLSAVLEYPHEPKKFGPEIKEKEHQIKDTMVTSLRAKTLAEANNTVELKENLLKDVNKLLRYGNFTGMYFTDFLIQ
jgi:flagellar basal body-associated protein FliL